MKRARTMLESWQRRRREWQLSSLSKGFSRADIIPHLGQSISAYDFRNALAEVWPWPQRPKAGPKGVLP